MKWLNVWKWRLVTLLAVLMCSLCWLRLPPQGLQATYFYHPNFQGTPIVSKIERQADLTTLLYGRTYSPKEVFMRKTDISILWEGWLRIDHDGEYSFTLESDSIASLSIDDIVIIRNHINTDLMPVKRRGSLLLSRGQHRIIVRYAQWDDTPRKLDTWRQQTGASFEEYVKKLFASYKLSVQWYVQGVNESPISPEYLSPVKLSFDVLFLVRHRTACTMVYVLSWCILGWAMLGRSWNAYLKEHLRRNLPARIYKMILFLIWCIPSGIIFLGWKGIAFVAFLYFSGYPFSVLLKKQCFWLERIVLSVSISVVLFAFTLSWLLHIAPFHSAVITAICLYAFMSIILSFWNWRQQITDADCTGSKMVYGILLAFNIFICLVSVNVQHGWEQAAYGDTLMRIINHDYSYWGYKYSSILYDALIYAYLPPSPVSDVAADSTAIISPYALPRYYARAITLSAIQLYLMTAISMLSLFVPNRLAVVIASFTYYFFSASLGTYTFFTLHAPLGAFSNNYALVQYPNLFFALFLPIYGLWRRSRPAIIIGFVCVAFLPASHPAYFLIIVGVVALFPAILYFYRRYRLYEYSLSTIWKHYYCLYGVCGIATASTILIHGSFLREFLLTVLHISKNSSASSLWIEMFLTPPKFLITFRFFSSVYPVPAHPLPLWDTSNLAAFPPWVFFVIALLPYLFINHKVLGYIISSVYAICFFYLLRGLPIKHNGNLVDVYQPFDVLFHLSMLIASYSLLEFVFYQKKHRRTVYKITIGILLLLTYLLTGINMFFATIYIGVLANGGGPYIISLFKGNIPVTIQQSIHLYAEAFRLLW